MVAKAWRKCQVIYHDHGTVADISEMCDASVMQIAYIETRMHCANPGCSGAGLKKCANCLQVFFCSKECQVAAWPAHRADCKRRVEARAAKNALPLSTQFGYPLALSNIRAVCYMYASFAAQ
jgi:hypothetical protein